MTKTIISILTALLIFLWVYAAMSKLLDYDTARDEMLKQVFPVWISTILVWLVPLCELVVAGLLLFERTRTGGIIASLILLIAFTGYIALIQLNYFDYVPCTCGGVISKLTWEEHFLFNMAFIVLSGTALILREHEKILSANNREKPKTRIRVGKNF